MKVWELIAFLSSRPAGEDVRISLEGNNQIPVVDLVAAGTDDDEDHKWVVLKGEDPGKYEL